MTYNQLLEYYYFYKGEVICPEEFDKKNEGELWFAEKMICEDLLSLLMMQTLVSVLHKLWHFMWANGILILSMK